MTLYATTTSERASKGQGGNEYLETLYYLTSKENPQVRVKVTNDEKIGLIYFSIEEYFFNKWTKKYTQKYYINVELKGKSQKGESVDIMECEKCKSKLNDDYFCNKCSEYQ